MKPANCFDRKRFNVIPWDHRKSIKSLIVKNHYLESWPSNVEHERNDNYFCFGVLKDWERLVGGIIFGGPNTRGLVKSISPLLEWKEAVELHRLWIEDGHGSNIESRVISQAFKLLPAHVKVVYSLADPEQGHLGTIYQAANGWFQSFERSGGYRFNFTPDCDPKEWKSPRWIIRNLGNPKNFHITLAHLEGYWRKPDVDKYRYLWFLRDVEQIKNTLRHPISKDYPKQLKECGAPEWIRIHFPVGPARA